MCEIDTKMKSLIDSPGMRQIRILGEVIEIWPLHCHDFSLRCTDCELTGKIRCQPRFWVEDPEKVYVDKNCPVCGTVFTTYIWELRRGRGIFCGRSCAAIAKLKLGMLRGRPRTGKKVPCTTCGKLIYKQPKDLEKFKKFFCNRSCKGVDNGRRFGIGSPNNPLTKKQPAGAIT